MRPVKYRTIITLIWIKSELPVCPISIPAASNQVVLTSQTTTLKNSKVVNAMKTPKNSDTHRQRTSATSHSLRSPSWFTTIIMLTYTHKLMSLSWMWVITSKWQISSFVTKRGIVCRSSWRQRLDNIAIWMIWTNLA